MLILLLQIGLFRNFWMLKTKYLRATFLEKTKLEKNSDTWSRICWFASCSRIWKTRVKLWDLILTSHVFANQSAHDVTNECSVGQLKASKYLKYSSNISDIQDADIYIVTVPTPVDETNRPNLSPLISATKWWAKYWKRII